MIGSKVLNYRIDSFIDKGGMGSVYLGIHEKLGRKVAIKVLHNHLAQNDQLRRRFKNEAESMAKLQHPNIVTLYDYDENEDGLFLIMEYVEGMELGKYINHKTGPIPTDLTVELFGQLLDGFDYAHKNGVVHRDIKPSNILITKDNKVKILDFGIAKLVEGDKSLTKTGTQMGSVLYMSPEQVKGKHVDNRSDIYSLGVTLFQMVTGKCPYDKDTTEYEIYDKIVKEPLSRIAVIYPGVNTSFQALIDKATEKDVSRRYATCAEFKNSLLNLGTTVEDEGETIVGPGGPIVGPEDEDGGETIIVEPGGDDHEKEKNNKGLYVVIGVLSVLLLMVIGYNFVQNDKEEIAEGEETILTEAGTSIVDNNVSESEGENTAAQTTQARSLDDLSRSEMSYDLSSSGTIKEGEQFSLNLRPSGSLENHFKYSLNCDDCASLNNASANNYSAKINRAGSFNVEVLLTDTRTGQTKSLGTKSFTSKAVQPNSDPESTMRYWLRNIGNQKGYSMQTRWNYNDYINGYGTTYRTELKSLKLISNDGQKAQVRVEYKSYDSQNSNLHLIQMFDLKNTNDGWKWTFLYNISIKQI